MRRDVITSKAEQQWARESFACGVWFPDVLREHTFIYVRCIRNRSQYYEIRSCGVFGKVHVCGSVLQGASLHTVRRIDSR